jgi:hypothetical protein
MSDPSSALDDAFGRMAGSDFELPNGFVNHRPMACEALAALGRHDEIDGWSRWFAQMVGEGPKPTPPRGTDSFAWDDALGDYRRLPEWIGYFERVIADHGWASVVALWIPRLSPGTATVLFHGVIRTAHAVRAVDGIDTPPRRAELARSLGYWAARFQPGPPPEDAGRESGVGSALVEAAAHGARHYVMHPSIFNLHGVTGAMAVDLLAPHIAPEAAAGALGQIRADHGALYGGGDPVMPTVPSLAWDEGIARRVADSRDAHQVKLVEACRRGFDATGDPAFSAAAARVTERS